MSTIKFDPVEVVAAGLEGEALEGVHYGSAVAHDGLPRHDAAETDGDSAVEQGAGYEGGEDAEGKVALRLFALFGSGGDRIEADVGEEDDGAAGEHARPAIGHEGVPVDGLDEAGCRSDEREDGDDLDEDEDVVGASGLADAADEDHGEDHDDEEGGDVEAEVPAGGV